MQLMLANDKSDANILYKIQVLRCDLEKLDVKQRIVIANFLATLPNQTNFYLNPLSCVLVMVSQLHVNEITDEAEI